MKIITKMKGAAPTSPAQTVNKVQTTSSNKKDRQSSTTAVHQKIQY